MAGFDYEKYYYDNLANKHLSSDIDPETGKSISQTWKDSFLGNSSNTSKSGSGNSSGGTRYVVVNNGMGDYFERYMAALQEQQRAAEARLQAQIDSAVKRMEANRPIINQQYEDSARQAYLNKVMAQRDLPQQLAASGLSGGMSETANLQLQNSYDNALGSLAKEKNNALAQLDTDIAGVQASGDIALAENANTYAEKMADAALQAMANQKQATRVSTTNTGKSSQTNNVNTKLLNSPNLRNIMNRISNHEKQLGGRYTNDLLEYDLQYLYNEGVVTEDELRALAYNYGLNIL